MAILPVLHKSNDLESNKIAPCIQPQPATPNILMTDQASFFPAPLFPLSVLRFLHTLQRLSGQDWQEKQSGHLCL